MISHYPAKFGGRVHCASEDMMFLVVEGQDSACPGKISRYCLFLKHMA